MDIDGILDYKNTTTDDIGNVLRSGDVCINTDYYKFVKVVDGMTFIDLSSLSLVKRMPNITPRIYSVIFFSGDGKPIQIPIDNKFKTFKREWLYGYPMLFLTEMLELEDGARMPFLHSYNIQFNAWIMYQRRERTYSVVKLDEHDIHKIFLKLPNDPDGHSKIVMEKLAKDSRLIVEDIHTLTLCYADMKCSRLMSKRMKSIKARLGWVKHTGHLPVVKMEFNGSKENILTTAKLNSQIYLLSDFYNADKEIQDIKLFCTKHDGTCEEILYKYRKSAKSPK